MEAEAPPGVQAESAPAEEAAAAPMDAEASEPPAEAPPAVPEAEAPAEAPPAPPAEAAEAALRECHEETGYSAKVAHGLGELNPNPALFNNTLYTFYGFVTETTPSEYSSETEKTEVELVPIDALKPLLLDGRIDHALVCATLWRFLYMLSLIHI